MDVHVMGDQGVSCQSLSAESLGMEFVSGGADSGALRVLSGLNPQKIEDFHRSKRGWRGGERFFSYDAHEIPDPERALGIGEWAFSLRRAGGARGIGVFR
jgi:hypothetical protein